MPPFIGSIVYRSVQFSVFELFYTLWKNDEALCKEIPKFGGVEYRTVLAGFLAGTVRSFIETPVEYAKVKRQTGQIWNGRQIYKGFCVLYPRSTMIMTTYFTQFELARKNTNLFSHAIGQFIVSGIAALNAYALISPLEVIKNMT